MFGFFVPAVYWGALSSLGVRGGPEVATLSKLKNNSLCSDIFSVWKALPPLTFVHLGYADSIYLSVVLDSGRYAMLGSLQLLLEYLPL